MEECLLALLGFTNLNFHSLETLSILQAEFVQIVKLARYLFLKLSMKKSKTQIIYLYQRQFKQKEKEIFKPTVLCKEILQTND